LEIEKNILWHFLKKSVYILYLCAIREGFADKYQKIIFKSSDFYISDFCFEKPILFQFHIVRLKD
jgi:hypothetical protein